MKSHAFRRFPALLMLLFFAGYGVAPVSSFIPTYAPDENEACKSADSGPDLFLCDLALWQILKKTRLPDGLSIASLITFGRDGNGRDVKGTKHCIHSIPNSSLPFYFRRSPYDQADNGSVLHAARFGYPGLSPPSPRQS